MYLYIINQSHRTISQSNFHHFINLLTFIPSPDQPYLFWKVHFSSTHSQQKITIPIKSQLGNLVGNSLIGICLTLPNLGFLWVFFKYPKISTNWNPLFFPVTAPMINFLSACHLWWTVQDPKANHNTISMVYGLHPNTRYCSFSHTGCLK